MWLYYIETYGYNKAEKIFRQDYIKEKGHVKSFSNMYNVLEGKLLYLKMVKGEQDPTYLKLQQRFDKAFGLDIEKLLQVWETEGFEKAEELYKIMIVINRIIRTTNIDWTEERIEKEFEKLEKVDISLLNTAVSHPKIFQKINPKTAWIFKIADEEYYEREIAPHMQEKILK